MEREKFSSRLGFILISAGCAIGLGNVWRFPYVVGQYGGALFVLIYLLFLVILGAPIMTMEFAVGRASQKSAVKAFETIEPTKKKWKYIGYFHFFLVGSIVSKAFTSLLKQLNQLKRNGNILVIFKLLEIIC